MGHAAHLKNRQPTDVVPALIPVSVPRLFTGFASPRSASVRSCGRGDEHPAPPISHAQCLESYVIPAWTRPARRVAKITSLVVNSARYSFIVFFATQFALDLQLLAASGSANAARRWSSLVLNWISGAGAAIGLAHRLRRWALCSLGSRRLEPLHALALGHTRRHYLHRFCWRSRRTFWSPCIAQPVLRPAALVPPPART